MKTQVASTLAKFSLGVFVVVSAVAIWPTTGNAKSPDGKCNGSWDDEYKNKEGKKIGRPLCAEGEGSKCEKGSCKIDGGTTDTYVFIQHKCQAQRDAWEKKCGTDAPKPIPKGECKTLHEKIVVCLDFEADKNCSGCKVKEDPKLPVKTMKSFLNAQ